jgi:predicted metal-dependent TIM-barrel fold hydrolase
LELAVLVRLEMKEILEMQEMMAGAELVVEVVLGVAQLNLGLLVALVLAQLEVQLNHELVRPVGRLGLREGQETQEIQAMVERLDVRELMGKHLLV